jgi:hypothetical protein
MTVKLTDKFVRKALANIRLYDLHKLIDAVAFDEKFAEQERLADAAAQKLKATGLEFPLRSEGLTWIAPADYLPMLEAAHLIDVLAPSEFRGEYSNVGLTISAGRLPSSYQINFEYGKNKSKGKEFNSAGKDLLLYLQDRFPDQIDTDSIKHGGVKTFGADIPTTFRVKEGSRLDTVLKAFAQRTQAQTVDLPPK